VVTGLATFAAAFAEHQDQYVLIGGTACELVMDEAGLSFRATKDLDIVLCARELDPAFAHKFWDFVTAGRYQSHEKSVEPSQFYRFTKPATSEYPYMLELFSRKPAEFELTEGAHLTPVPVPGDVASLSAILLDDDYEALIREGSRVVEGVSVVGAHELVILKARAWLDLTSRQSAGEKSLTKHIKKHRNDVFRLYQILDPDQVPAMKDGIRPDVASFLQAMSREQVALKDLGLKNARQADVLNDLRRMYGIG
jgi:hypothetical protein